VTQTGGVRVARIFGIPVYVHFSWIVVFSLITWTLATGYFPAKHPNLPVASYWARGLVASLLFFVSILLHELGHSLVALRHGIAIESITLFIFGGVARLAGDAPDGRTELKIAAAGPAVSFLLAFVFFAASVVLTGATQAVTVYLAAINVVVALFNLVPAFPLDGGRLLRGLLWGRLGKLRATRAAASAGTVFAYFLIVTGALRVVGGAGVGGMWQILIGWFLKEAAAGTYRQVKLDDALARYTVGDVMAHDVTALPAGMSLEEAARDHFLRTGYGAYPVVRGDTVVGLVALRDVMDKPADERAHTSVQAVMMPLTGEITASPDEPLAEAIARMSRDGVARMIVMSGPRLEGFLTLRGVLEVLQLHH
jgi:Zn-dependent protease/CBS domain-containing protein